MDVFSLSEQERAVLLIIARDAVESAAARKRLPDIKIDDLPINLREMGASFVTLTENGRLRGCIGALEAHQPLAVDVQEHAAAAAVEDFRFSPVRPNETGRIHIEISRLTPAMKLDYQEPADLPGLLRPGIDGVILTDGRRRATFLPQVWEKMPRCEDFLSQLCLKMGASHDLWKSKKLEIWTYQVEAFEEE